MARVGTKKSLRRVARDAGRQRSEALPVGTRRASLLAGTALALSLAAPLAAAQTQWIAGNGNWNTSGNWSTGVVPSTAATNVVINPAGAVTVTHSSGTHRIGSLTVGANDTLSITGGILGTSANSTVNGTLTLGTGGTLEINGGTLSLLGGNADLRGTLAITSASSRLIVGGSANVINGLDGSGSNALSVLEIPGFVQFSGDSSFGGRLLISGSSSAVLGGATLALGSLDVDGTAFTTFQVNGGALPGSGATVTVSGLTTVRNSTLNVGAGAFGLGRVNTSGYFQDSGTLAGRGVVTASGLTRLFGGTLTGDGRLQANGAIQISGDVDIDAGRHLVIAGGGTWGFGTIDLDPSNATDNGRSAGRITNEVGSVLVANRVNQMTRGFGATDAEFINKGTFRKNDTIAAPGTTTIGVRFTNEATGTIDVVKGKLLINGSNATLGGTLSIGPEGAFELGGASNVINGLTATAIADLDAIVISGFATFTGTSATGGQLRLTSSSQGISGTLNARDVLVDGTFQLGVNASGTLTTSNLLSITDGRLNVADGASVTAGRLTMTNGGILQGPGDVTVTGQTTLLGGSLAGNGQLIANGAVSILGDVTFDSGRALVVNAGASWLSGSIDLDASNAVDGGGDGGRIINTAGSVFTAGANNSILRSAGATDAFFINAGTLRRSATGATSAVSTLLVPYLGFAGSAIEVEGRTLELIGGNSVVTGTVDVAAGATLTLGGSSNVVSNMNGAASGGTLRLVGGTSFQGNSTYGSAGPDLSDNRILAVGGTHGLAAGATLLARSLVIGDGATPSSFSVAGALGLNDALRVTNGLLTVTPTGTVAAGGYADTTNATIQGGGSITIDGPATFAGARISDNGTIVTNGLATFSGAADKRFDSGRILDIRGGATWAAGDIDLNPTSAVDNGLDGARIVNRAGSIFSIQNNASMFATSGTADVRFTNEGVLRKGASSTTGTTTIAVPFTNAAGGSVEVSEDTLLFTGNVSNFASGTLTGGTWKASGSGTLAIFTTVPIATNNATLVLEGPGSTIGARFGAITTPIDQSLTTNNGTLRLVTRAMIGPQAVTNNGTLDLVGGSASFASLTNSNGATISGHGVLGNRVSNSGTIRASGGNLALSQGVAGANGTLQVDAGASMSLAGTLANTTRFLVHNGTDLNLGSRDITVFKDYTSASFGTGNGFDARAGVTGSGLIIGNGAGQAIVSGGSTFTGADVVLDFGFTRGGAPKTLTYRIANTGSATAADLRGAIQTSFAGGGITAPGLSGSGVTAQNFGPINGGTSSGTFSVTYTGGSLAGQSLRVVNSFDNVAEQTISFTGGSTQLAIGSAASVPASAQPVDIGNFRVGLGAPTRSFAVTNATTGPGAESLAIGSVATSGNFAASAIHGGLITPGATQTPGFTIGVSGGVAGVNAGTVSVGYLSNGQAFDPGFTNVASNTQDIAVTASGFALAKPNALPATFNLGTVLVGSSVTRFLTLSNDLRGGVPAGFQEGLDAAFGTVTGPNATKFTVGGALSNLAAGATSSSALSISLDTSVAGSFGASVPVEFWSNGAGTSGFGVVALPTQLLGLSAGVVTDVTVVNAAAPAILNAPLAVAARRIGDAPALAALQVRNDAAAPAEAMSASFAGTSGAAVANGASIAGLAAQTTDGVTMRVGVDTSVVGLRSGQVTVGFAGELSGALPSQTVDVAGKVYARAQADTLASATLDFGVVRRGDATPARSLAIGNAAALDALNDTLVGTLAGVTGGFAATLDPMLSGSGLGAGLTAASGFTATMLTSSAGVKNGNATIGFLGRNPDMADDVLGSRAVALVGQVNDVAKPVFAKESGAGTLTGGGASYTLALGSVMLGDVVTVDLDLLNDIVFGDSLAGSFDVSGLGAALSASGFVPVSIAAGGLYDDLFLTFTGSSLGAYAGHLTFDWASVYPGLADLAGAQIRIDVSAVVVDGPPSADVPAPGTLSLLGFGAAVLAWRRRRAA
jgi:hypothetical protein